jgi:hypothetical protein
MLCSRAAVSAITLMLVSCSSLSAASTVKTFKGWFSDLSCATPRATSGVFTATNPECAKKCIESGVAPAFISDEAKAVFRVQGHPTLKDDLGYYVEVTGDVDLDAKTLNVRSVKRLEYQGASCARPKPAAKK